MYSTDRIANAQLLLTNKDESELVMSFTHGSAVSASDRLAIWAMVLQNSTIFLPTDGTRQARITEL